MMKREFYETKTFKYDFKGRVVKETKHVIEAVDEGTDDGASGGEETQETTQIGFQYESTDAEENEEDDD